MSPFVNVEGSWYFLSSDMSGNAITGSQLMVWDGISSNSPREICTNQTNPTLISVGSGLCYFAGKLYFNTYFGLYAYDLSTESMTELIAEDRDAITGCRLEESTDGKVIKYQINGNVMTYQIDPYTYVSNEYGYYQSEGKIYLCVTGDKSVILACYDAEGKMRDVEVFVQKGSYVTLPEESVKRVFILVTDKTEWNPACDKIELAA